MWVIDVVCSDSECAELQEVVVAELEESERAVCECGCCVVVLSVAELKPALAVVVPIRPAGELEPPVGAAARKPALAAA